MMTRRSCDEKTVHISMRPSARSFSAFKADPRGLFAESDLRDAFAFVEGIEDPKERAETARKLAMKLMAMVNGASEDDRRSISVSISAQLAKPSSTRSALEELIAEGSQSQEIRSETASFRIHLERLIRENPRFAGMGQMRLDVGSEQVSVKKENTLPDKLQSWWYRRRWPILSGIIAGTSLILSLSMGSEPRVVKQTITRASAPATDEMKEDDGGRITPEDPVVLKAVAAAIGKKDGNLSLGQIFRVYDYVVRNVRYTDISDQKLPRWPKLTLEAGIGDCKSMSALLSSMLEAIGGKTVILSWHSSKDNDGHDFVAVMVSDARNAAMRAIQARAVRKTIIRRYWHTIRSFYGGKIPPIHIREYDMGGSKKTFLLLDATGGGNALPGMALTRQALETLINARPDKEGYVPVLE